jgi:hypothetical protein
MGCPLFTCPVPSLSFLLDKLKEKFWKGDEGVDDCVCADKLLPVLQHDVVCG